MLTIAGGIILAIILLAVLGAFLEPIVEAVGYLVIFLIGLAVIGCILYFTANNFEVAIIVIPLTVAAFYFYTKKTKKKYIDSENERKNKTENEQKKRELFEQLEVDKKLSELFSSAGELLLNSVEDDLFNRQREIQTDNFTFSFKFNYENMKYTLDFIQNDELKKLNLYKDYMKKENHQKSYENYEEYGYLPKRLDIDNIFNLDSDLSKYLKKQIKIDIEESKNSKITSQSFFEDMKYSITRNNKIFIYQHLISENGIKMSTPIQCLEKIEANVFFNLQYFNINLKIDHHNVGVIEFKKWNDLRKNKKIIFENELN